MVVQKKPNKYIRYLIIIFISIVAIGLIFSIPVGNTSGDFDVYYAASRNYLANAPVYIPRGGIEEFKYSPMFALIFSPLALIDKALSLYLWGILNILLLYLIFYLFYKLRLISFSGLRDFGIIFCLLALTGRYLFSDIKIGQVNIFLCFLLVLMMYFEVNKKYLPAAICLALSLMIKLFPLLFLAYFVLRRRFKILAYTIVMVLIFLLLPALYSGFAQNLQYLREWFELLKTTPAPIIYSAKNFSLLAFFSWFFVARYEGMFVLNYRFITKGLTPEVYYAWLAACFILFSLFFYDSFFKKDKPQQKMYLDYACLFTCGLLFNPLAYLNALIFLIVPYFFILRTLFYSELVKRWAIVIGILTLLCFISTMAYNKCFFPDRHQFYRFLEFRLPLWTMLLVYLNLFLIKLARPSLSDK
ncbi:MAG: DUF2029 domain-containing protein [Candidatus Omnitrophica bacterium]|jgi:hypothetical protein|nr:DUF2029 domain-containing protein [Candidatus Omnitrophota bacterium]